MATRSGISVALALVVIAAIAMLVTLAIVLDRSSQVQRPAPEPALPPAVASVVNTPTNAEPPPEPPRTAAPTERRVVVTKKLVEKATERRKARQKLPLPPGEPPRFQANADGPDSSPSSLDSANAAPQATVVKANFSPDATAPTPPPAR